MKKVIFILAIVLAAILGSMTNAYADSVAVHLIGSDNLQPSYGLSLETNSGLFYAAAEDSTNKGFQTNTALVSAGINAGPFNFGPVVGAQFQQSTGTVSGMAGAELGIRALISGPIYAQENTRVIRGAGGVSNGQVDFALGFNF
jgi:hypothetical protein